MSEDQRWVEHWLETSDTKSQSWKEPGRYDRCQAPPPETSETNILASDYSDPSPLETATTTTSESGESTDRSVNDQETFFDCPTSSVTFSVDSHSSPLTLNWPPLAVILRATQRRNRLLIDQRPTPPQQQRYRPQGSRATASCPRLLPPVPTKDTVRQGTRRKKLEPTPDPVPPQYTPPITPLTPWRRLVSTHDYSDRDENLSTIIDRLDDAIASTPELWTHDSSPPVAGQPVHTLEFYRRLHEFQQRQQ